MTTVGLRLNPVTPRKSSTTTSPGLNERLVLRVHFGGVLQREGHQLTLILLSPSVTALRNNHLGLGQILEDERPGCARPEICKVRQFVHDDPMVGGRITIR